MELFKNNLDDLKVGDRAIVKGYAGWHTAQMTLVTVEKVHKLHVIAGGQKYSKQSGRLAGPYRYHTSHLEHYDEQTWREYVIAERLRRARVRLTHLNWNDVPDDIVTQVYNLIPKKQEAP